MKAPANPHAPAFQGHAYVADLITAESVPGKHRQRMTTVTGYDAGGNVEWQLVIHYDGQRLGPTEDPL